jgi:cell wall-associated NlpC family hydrolase
MINIAKDWINTPFVVGGYTKYGCDCIGLIIGVLNQSGLKIKPDEYFEMGNYNHLNLDKVVDIVEKYCIKISHDSVEIGDIIMFSSYKNTAHFAIVSNLSPFSIIHAHQNVGKVVETISDNIWQTQILYCFRIVDFT